MNYEALNEAVSKKGDRDVIVDFSRVEIINSSNISNLLILHNMQVGCGHRLILCNVATVTKCIFVVAGLNEVFDFAKDITSAMATVGQAG